MALFCHHLKVVPKLYCTILSIIIHPHVINFNINDNDKCASGHDSWKRRRISHFSSSSSKAVAGQHLCCQDSSNHSIHNNNHNHISSNQCPSTKEWCKLHSPNKPFCAYREWSTVSWLLRLFMSVMVKQKAQENNGIITLSLNSCQMWVFINSVLWSSLSAAYWSWIFSKPLWTSFLFLLYLSIQYTIIWTTGSRSEDILNDGAGHHNEHPDHWHLGSQVQAAQHWKKWDCIKLWIPSISTTNGDTSVLYPIDPHTFYRQEWCKKSCQSLETRLFWKALGAKCAAKMVDLKHRIHMAPQMTKHKSQFTLR
jgi:hypothetical protein